jgi:hypothetical protein
MTKLRTTQAVDTETNNMIHKGWTLQCMTKLKTTQAVDAETNNMIHKLEAQVSLYRSPDINKSS